LRGIARFKEALFDASSLFIPITSIPRIAVDKHDRMMPQRMPSGDATPSPEAVSPFLILQDWEVVRECHIRRGRPTVSHLMLSRGDPTRQYNEENEENTPFDRLPHG
jgi:hypothetical protein